MENKKLALGSVGIVILAGCLYRFICITLDASLQTIESPLFVICEVLLLIPCSVIACIFLHMSLILWSDHHSVFSVMLVYSLNIFFGPISKFAMRSFKKQTKNFRKTQENFLLDGLKLNANTAYGKDFEFNEIRNLEDFKEKHPLTTYSHYQKYVDRICNGEENVMTKEKTVRLTLTSGTTGISKKIPYTKKSLSSMQLNSAIYAYASFNKDKRFESRSCLQRSMMVICPATPKPKIAGIPVGPLAMLEPSQKKYMVFTTSPPAAFDICTEFESSYVHLLFGICDRYIVSLEGTFSPMLLNAFRILEGNWRQMLNDIERGHLNPDLNISDETWQELNQVIKDRSVAERIQFLRREFEKGFDGIAKRIWPKLQMVSCVDLGTSGEELKKTYLKGLPIITVGYGATEGFFAINLSLSYPPLYTLLPSSVLFEFIPVEQSGDDTPDIIFGDKVKVGEQYEMVVSNPTCGIYRFRFGDVIKVVDFYNQTPVVKFQYRYGQLMNLCGEKVDEAVLYGSIVKCVKRWSGLRLVEYSCAESTTMPDSERQTGPVHYVIFIEVEGENSKKDYVLTSEEKAMMELVLCEEAGLYKSFRDRNSIGVMDVRQVKRGSFALLKKYIIDNSTASISQFKVPRKLKTAGAVKYLLGETIKQ